MDKNSVNLHSILKTVKMSQRVVQFALTLLLKKMEMEVRDEEWRDEDKTKEKTEDGKKRDKTSDV